LEKQKKGKERLAQFGKITIPAEVFLKVLKER
jgi:translation elongation factor EF-4